MISGKADHLSIFHRMYGNEKAVGEGIRQSGIARSELFVSYTRLADSY